MKRRAFIKSGLLFVPSVIIAQSVPLSKRTPFFQTQSTGASGPNVWYDGEIVANGTTEGANDSSTIYWQPITPSLGGTCTKLRIYQHGNSGAFNVKMGIWNGNKTVINANAFGTAASGANGAYIEVTLTFQPAVTGGTQYQIGWEPDTNTAGWWFQSTSGVFNFNNSGTYTYANFPNGNLPADNTLTRKYCVSMFVA